MFKVGSIVGEVVAGIAVFFMNPISGAEAAVTVTGEVVQVSAALAKAIIAGSAAKAAVSDVIQFASDGSFDNGKKVESDAKKARTQAELDDLAKDPTHGGKMDAKSIAERDVGLGLESQGKVGKLVRDPSGSAEFIDTVTGQKWDVKAFNSNFAPKGYNLTDAMANISKSISNGEYVMLDTRNRNSTDLAELVTEIFRQGFSSKILLWP